MAELKGWHHGYLGILLMLTGFLISFSNKTWGLILSGSGFYFYADDLCGDAFNWKTPLRRLIAWLWRFKMVRDITHFFDGLFGREW